MNLSQHYLVKGPRYIRPTYLKTDNGEFIQVIIIGRTKSDTPLFEVVAFDEDQENLLAGKSFYKSEEIVYSK